MIWRNCLEYDNLPWQMLPLMIPHPISVDTVVGIFSILCLTSQEIQCLTGRLHHTGMAWDVHVGPLLEWWADVSRWWRAQPPVGGNYVQHHSSNILFMFLFMDRNLWIINVSQTDGNRWGTVGRHIYIYIYITITVHKRTKCIHTKLN